MRTPGALSIFKLFAALDADEMRGTVVGVPAMNVPAFEAGKRGDPEEGVVFGLRSRPAVIEGEWCCFFGIIDEVRDDLLG